MFQFIATAASDRTYVFGVRQTYDDDTVVDWAGAADSDTPAARVEAQQTPGGSGSSTIAIIALVAATLAVLLACAAVLGTRHARPLT